MAGKMILAAALLPLAIGVPARAQPPPVVAMPGPPPHRAGAVLVPRDTMVRLMVLNEVNTRKARAGDRFVLRVDEKVVVGGATVIPVGARAFGEVTSVEPNGAAGKAGAIGAKLLYLEVGGERIPLGGEDRSQGRDGGDDVAMAVGAFSLFGLLVRGSEGKLKAGHIIDGYIAADLLFDPVSGRFLPSATAQAVTRGPRRACTISFTASADSSFEEAGYDSSPARLSRLVATTRARLADAARRLCAAGALRPEDLARFRTLVIQNGEGATEPIIYEDVPMGPHFFVFQFAFQNGDPPGSAAFERALRCWKSPEKPGCYED